MAITVGGTAITFNDGTTQTTAAGANSYTGDRAQIFTSSGTFTVPTGVTSLKVTVIGGGGGSGGASGNGNNGGGGAGGGLAIKYITGLTPGGTVSVTVGAAGAGGSSGTVTGSAGGTSSFGAYCSATGGAGGLSNLTTYNSGGTATGGDINITGGSGGRPWQTGCFPTAGGSGGAAGGGRGNSSQYNGPISVYVSGASGYIGAGGNTGTFQAVGSAGTGYGNGGGAPGLAGINLAGAAGSQGVVIVEW